MADWLTANDLVIAFGDHELRELTGREGFDATDDEAVARACERAMSEAAALIRRRVPTFPTPSMPKAVIMSAADIARYYLYEDAAPELVAERYAAARRFLLDAVFSPEELGLTGGDSAGVAGIVASTRKPRLDPRQSAAYAKLIDMVPAA